MQGVSRQDDAEQCGPPGTVGLYVHIPFCERVCPYCDFAVVAAPRLDPHTEDRYLEALEEELTARAPCYGDRRLTTLYLGGGTPSLFRPHSLERLLAKAQQVFAPALEKARLEITLEVNPSTVERERLPDFFALGINRLSIGVQSFDDATLRRLGRAHKAEEGARILEAARTAGFANLSLDLILAAPGQTFAGFEADLERALEFEPEHLSIYELTVESGTPFELAARRNQLRRADEDTVVDMLEHTVRRAAASGLARYEISNYARPGFESAHNTRYWSREPVLGIGMGAWSNLPPDDRAPFGRRRSNPRELARYLEGVESRGDDGAEVEILSAAQARGEAIFLALRHRRGLCAAGFEAEFGFVPRHYFPSAILRLVETGLLVETEVGDLRLTERGQLLSDSVFAHFV